MSVYALDNVIQNYAWGHPSRLAELQGRAPGELPEAELWLGSHSCAPSRVVMDGRTVDIREVLTGCPGAPDGGELPFLLKILAIGGPLSIQVHPDLQQARDGYAAEEAAGVPLDDPSRSYKDDSDKPEVVVALEPMRILVGVLDPAERRGLVEAGLDWVEAFVDASPADLVTGIFAMSDDDAAAALDALSAASLPTDRAELVRELLDRYPGDRGILVATCMNLVHLPAGAAMFTPAGVLHAYVSGTAVEIMNPSDNVLRAGLTPKHVDVPELARILVDDQSAPKPSDVTASADGGERIPLWRDDLSLRRFAGAHAGVELDDVTIVLGTRGRLAVRAGGAHHEVPAGYALLVVGEATLDLSGEGEAYLAGCTTCR